MSAKAKLRHIRPPGFTGNATSKGAYRRAVRDPGATFLGSRMPRLVIPDVSKHAPWEHARTDKKQDSQLIGRLIRSLVSYGVPVLAVSQREDGVEGILSRVKVIRGFREAVAEFILDVERWGFRVEDE